MDNFPLIAVIVFALFFAYLSWVRRPWAVLFIIGFLPMYVISFDLWVIPTTLLEIMLIIVTVVFVLQEFKNHRKLKLPWIIPVAFFIATSLAATVVSPDPESALGLLKAYIIEPILFFYIALNTLSTRKDFERVVWVLGGSILYITAMTVAQLVNFNFIPGPWNDGFGDFRTTSLFPYPNAVGLFVAPIVALFMGVVWDARILEGRKKLLAIAVIALGVFSILTAQSQGALFGVAAAVFFFGFFVKPWWKIPGALIVVSALAFVVPQTRDVLLPLVTFTDVSGDVRLAMWQGTWNLLRAHPVTGAGLAGFPMMYETYKLAKHTELLLYPHNVLLNFWVELGLAGLAATTWILVLFFKKCAAVFKHGTEFSRLSVSVMGGMVALLAHGLVDVPFFKNDLAVLFWIFPLLIFLIASNSQKPKKPLS